MPPGAPGAYLIASLDGRDVAALAPPAFDVPTAWNTYVAVEDADAGAAAVTAAGGTVAAGPDDAGPGGRFALCADPAGARFRLWQARRRLGAQLVNAPGHVELQRPAHARPRHGDGVLRAAVRLGVRGPRLRDDDPPPGLRRPPGGDRRPGHPRPPGRRRRAAGVRGRDRVARARRVPASPTTGTSRSRSRIATRRPPRRSGSAATILAREDTDWTRTALVRDPQGAAFTLSQFTPPDSGD